MSEHEIDTIFALSSGRPPVAIAVIRISGPRVRAALTALGVKIPEPRKAGLARIRDPRSGEIIDEALVLWFPGPHSETGEDVAELQAHGGRAVVAAILDALAHIDGLRMAEGGEFTRRGFENGKLDLTAVEGLADLVGAETEAQRRQAFRQMKGLLGNRAETWRRDLIKALALVEAGIDFSDEADVPEDLMAPALKTARYLRDEIAAALADGGRGERLREGLVVAIAGPPNAGKSTLLNRIARREVAIVSPYAGTTRDVIEVHLDLGGLPVTLLDTAGIRDTDDPVELEGVRRARERAAGADLVLWVVDASAEAASGALAAARPVADVEQAGGDSADAAGAEGASQGGGAGPLAQSGSSGTGGHLGKEDKSARLGSHLGARNDEFLGEGAAGLDGGLVHDSAKRLIQGSVQGAVQGPAAGLVQNATRGPAFGSGDGSAHDLAHDLAHDFAHALVRGGSADSSAFDLDKDSRVNSTRTAQPGLSSRPAVWCIYNKIDLLLARKGQKASTEQLVIRNESNIRSSDKSESIYRYIKSLEHRDNLSLIDKNEGGFLSKADASEAASAEVIDKSEQEIFQFEHEFNLSASSGYGFETLLTGLTHYAEGHLAGAEQAIVTRARHRLALEQTLAALDRALAPGLAEDLLAEEFRTAAHALGRLTGRIDVEDILDVIFRDFCIGK